jgi:hypothetical protein
MRSTIFWDITLCSPLKVNWRFGSAFHLLSRWYPARLIRPWRWRQYVPPKHRSNFNELHGVTLLWMRAGGKSKLKEWREVRQRHNLSDICFQCFQPWRDAATPVGNKSIFWGCAILWYLKINICGRDCMGSWMKDACGREAWSWAVSPLEVYEYFGCYCRADSSSVLQDAVSCCS